MYFKGAMTGMADRGGEGVRQTNPAISGWSISENLPHMGGRGGQAPAKTRARRSDSPTGEPFASDR